MGRRWGGVVVFNVVAYTAVIALNGDIRCAPGMADRTAGQAMSSRGRSVDPDRTLVDEATAGNLEAFEDLVRRHQTRLVSYVLAIVRDTGEAEDVAQETFIKAYRSLRRFRGESSFKTWLYTIATNTARTALERRGRRERVGDQSLDDDSQTLSAGSVPSGLPDAETTLVARDAIDRALAVLPDDLRIAVVLRDVEGLDYKEVANITGSPIGTVESRIFRARQRLRTLLLPLRTAQRSVASR
jgi:RNA polymerase sigma-70 factor (ECF subfamily)